ncbi:MAG: DUF1552 domain-containing protein, partial [Planctomycetota bacterium]|nr:DUF1552 domain-containing protein [Planctomycetota bacterium]
MTNLRQKALDRRTLLRGGAACLALPWLDAMQPAMSPPARRLRRAVFVFAPNGVNMDLWRTRSAEGEGGLGPTLAPLRPHRERLTVFGGLEISGGWSHGDGPGDHARAVASFLTCAHPRKTGGADLQAGVSVDQAIARSIA